jgi:hypothetical protein
VGAGAPAARPPTREATHAAEVPARAAEMAGGAAAATPVAATTSAEPPRKRKRGVFYPEVSDCFSSTVFLDRPGPKFLVFVLVGWRPPCLLLRLPRC